MSYVSEDRLIWMALVALEDVLEQCASRKDNLQSRSIAVCLAYLATRRPVARWPFDDFWTYLADLDPIRRSANLNRCINAICLQLKTTRPERSACQKNVERKKR